MWRAAASGFLLASVVQGLGNGDGDGDGDGDSQILFGVWCFTAKDEAVGMTTEFGRAGAQKHTDTHTHRHTEHKVQVAWNRHPTLGLSIKIPWSGELDCAKIPELPALPRHDHWQHSPPSEHI